jgi:hypothetical protein
MKSSHIRVISAVLFVLIGLGFIPAENTHAATTPSEQSQAEKEKEFLSDPDVAVGELETTTIDSLGFIKRRPPSFVRRMQRANKQDIKRAEITVDGRRFKVLLGERPEREFYLFDVEKGKSSTA